MKSNPMKQCANRNIRVTFQTGNFHSLFRFTPATVQLVLRIQSYNKSSKSSFHPSTIVCSVDITKMTSYSTRNILTRTITFVWQVLKENVWHKNSLKIPQGLSIAVNPGADHTKDNKIATRSHCPPPQ